MPQPAIVVAITNDLRLAAMPGNVSLPKARSGLAYDSVINVTQVATVDKDDLIELVGSLPADIGDEVAAGLRLVLAL